MFLILYDPSSGSTELCLTEITRSGSHIFIVCLAGVWQRNFETVVCVCTVKPYGIHKSFNATYYVTQLPYDIVFLSTEFPHST
jgi:hypothetical protein